MNYLKLMALPSPKRSRFLLFASIFFLAFTMNASAQLVNTLPINTGYENITPGVKNIGDQDPNWKISGLVSLSPPIGQTITYNAYCVHTWNYTSTPPYCPTDTRWISYDVNGMDENLGPVDPYGYDIVTFYREFETCIDDEIEIDGIFRSDNRITDVLVDGVSTGYSQSPVDNWSSSGGTAFNQTFSLAAGVHYIEVVVENKPQAGTYRNAIGLNFIGTINSTTSTNSIIDRDNYPQDVYSCETGEPGECNNLCYWKVEGNTILGSNNLFGTLNNKDIRIVSNFNSVGQERGVIKTGNSATGGYLGWNTMNPTARLHVDCNNGNDDASGLSDIRFENLERGEGYVLVIDDQGYVFRTQVHINDLTGGDGGADGGMQKNNEYIHQLEGRIEALEAKLNNTSAGNIGGKGVANTLAQNTPNPFNAETTISYNINSMKTVAYVAVYNLNGKQLNKFDIKKPGKGSIIINGGELPAGIYLYSLIVDGVETDTKRMVLSK